jgi:DNA-binding transcriptional MocR family regulator
LGREHSLTLAEKVATEIGRQIWAGILKPGDKLPSIREFARLHDLSKNTVIAAFDLLSDRSLVEAHHGKGFFVRASQPPRQQNYDDEQVGYSRAIDTIWLMRQQAVREPGHSHLAEGFPPVDWLMEMRLDRFQRQVTRTGVASLFRYGNRYGYSPLRQQLARRLADHGIETHERQIVTTFGANHALDLIIRRYVKPGDPVLVEEPGYYPLYGKLRLQGANLISIPRLVDGPCIQTLERILMRHDAGVFFMQSSAHNPTGTDLSIKVGQQLARLASVRNVLIIENDALADFKPSAAPRMAAITQLKNTLYVGSFSKSVSASLRTGFIAGDKAHIEELADIKMLLHIGSSEYGERILESILREGNFLRHITRLQDRLRSATEEGRKVLERFAAETFSSPTQSLYLWARFPGILDTRALTARMLQRSVVLAPGAFFHTNPEQTSPWTRLNVAYLQDENFIRSMRLELE